MASITGKTTNNHILVNNAVNFNVHPIPVEKIMKTHFDVKRLLVAKLSGFLATARLVGPRFWDAFREQPATVFVSPGGTVLDGMHRLAVAQKSGSPVRFVVITPAE